jgi:hypothetical protein
VVELVETTDGRDLDRLDRPEGSIDRGGTLRPWT